MPRPIQLQLNLQGWLKHLYFLKGLQENPSGEKYNPMTWQELCSNNTHEMRANHNQ